MSNINHRSTKIEAQIQRIETIMQEKLLYARERPDEKAFQSAAPFCYDTMTLLQWMQWVMFPRTREMIDKNLPLPTVCEVHPLAEEEFKLIEQQTDDLLAEILALDKLFNVCH